MKQDYLRRTLASLQAQTLPLERWELLLIDNASDESLATTCTITLDKVEGGFAITESPKLIAIAGLKRCQT